MTTVTQDARVSERAPAVVSPIPLCVPEIRGNEWAYIKECLDTNWVSSVGEYVDRFERALADASGARYGVATSSGTSALHTALMVAGVDAGDEVLVSTLTFIAPVNAIRYVGAWPVFIDAEPDYWQMDTARVAQFLEQNCERRGALGGIDHDGVARLDRVARHGRIHPVPGSADPHPVGLRGVAAILHCACLRCPQR